MKTVVRGKIERAKGFASLVRTFLKVFVEHLFPTRRVELGGIRNHTVEVEEHGVVLITVDHSNFRLRHRLSPERRPAEPDPRHPMEPEVALILASCASS